MFYIMTLSAAVRVSTSRDRGSSAHHFLYHSSILQVAQSPSVVSVWSPESRADSP